MVIDGTPRWLSHIALALALAACGKDGGIRTSAKKSADAKRAGIASPDAPPAFQAGEQGFIDGYDFTAAAVVFAPLALAAERAPLTVTVERRARLKSLSGKNPNANVVKEACRDLRLSSGRTNAAQVDNWQPGEPLRIIWRSHRDAAEIKELGKTLLASDTTLRCELEAKFTAKDSATPARVLHFYFDPAPQASNELALNVQYTGTARLGDAIDAALMLLERDTVTSDLDAEWTTLTVTEAAHIEISADAAGPQSKDLAQAEAEADADAAAKAPATPASSEKALPRAADNPVRTGKLPMRDFDAPRTEAIARSFDLIFAVSRPAYDRVFGGGGTTLVYDGTGGFSGTDCGRKGGALGTISAFVPDGASEVHWCRGVYLDDANIKAERTAMGLMFRAVTNLHEGQHAAGFKHDRDDGSYEPCTGSAYSAIVAVETYRCTEDYCLGLKDLAKAEYQREMDYSLGNDARRYRGLCAEWAKLMK